MVRVRARYKPSLVFRLSPVCSKVTFKFFKRARKWRGGKVHHPFLSLVDPS